MGLRPRVGLDRGTPHDRSVGQQALGQGDGGFRYWGVGVLLFPTARERWVIPAGYKSRWMTLAVRPRS